MGKHAKRSTRTTTKLATAVAVTGSIAALPVLTATSAHAATMAEWDATAQLESGGDWSINHSGDGMSVGGLQFQTASWNAALDFLAAQGYNVSSWNRNLYQGMPTADVPSKDQTILAGEALLHIQGPGAWANGNFSGSSSMFDGGPNPWGLPGTTAPAGIGAGGSSSGGSGVPVTTTGGSGVSDGNSDGDGSPATVSLSVPAPVPVGDGESEDDAATPPPPPVVKPPVVPPVVKVVVTTPITPPVVVTVIQGKHTVVKGEWLAKIAQHVYGDWTKWPVIYNANKAVIGANPNLIQPGQVLVIPKLA